MNPNPTIRRIVAVVRLAGARGCTIERVMHLTGATRQAVQKALDLQVQAGTMSSSEVWDGERYVGCVYRIREGA